MKYVIEVYNFEDAPEKYRCVVGGSELLVVLIPKDFGEFLGMVGRNRLIISVSNQYFGSTWIEVTQHVEYNGNAYVIYNKSL